MEPDFRADHARRLAPLRAWGSSPYAPAPPAAPPSRVCGALPTAGEGATVVSFSPDGAFLAVACVGGGGEGGGCAIRVFEVGEGGEGAEACEPLRGHDGLVYGLDWTPDGAWLLSASADGTARVWALPRAAHRAGAPLGARPALHAVLAHVPRSYVYAARFHPALPSLVVTGAKDGALRLWDARLADWGGGEGEERVVEGRLMGFIGGRPQWDASAAALAAAAAAAAPPPAGGEGSSQRGARARSRSRGRGPPAGGDDGARAPAGGPTAAAAYHINAVEWDAAAHADGSPRLLISGDSAGALRFYDARAPVERGAPARAEAYELVRELRPAAPRGGEPSGAVVSLRVRPGPRGGGGGGGGSPQLLVLAQPGHLWLLDALTFRELRRYEGVSCASRKVEACFSPDGALVAAGGEDGALRVWHADTRAPLPARAAITTRDRAGRAKEEGGSAPIAFPAQMLSVAWSPLTHAVAVAGCGPAYAVLVVNAVQQQQQQQLGRDE